MDSGSPRKYGKVNLKWDRGIVVITCTVHSEVGVSWKLPFSLHVSLPHHSLRNEQHHLQGDEKRTWSLKNIAI